MKSINYFPTKELLPKAAKKELLPKAAKYGSRRVYYIAYDEQININYVYLLVLHRIASYNKEAKTRSLIEYEKLSHLLDKMNKELERYNKKISLATVSRLLNDQNYKNYFTTAHNNKVIELKNNARIMKKFVALNDREVDLIL